MQVKNPNQTRVPILTYHSIDSGGSAISTSLDTFRSQLQLLRNRGFNVISLQDLIKCISKRKPFPSRSVVISFDDGFKNIYDAAYPVLKEFGFKAIVFLVPGYIEKSSKWNERFRDLPVLDVIRWDEAREMSENGIDFGAHTLHHSDLTQLSSEVAREEIVNSKLMIQKHLRKDVLFFAYPYGNRNRAIKNVVINEFSGACSTDLGYTNLRSSIYELPRIDMYYFSRNTFFSWIGTPAFSAYIRARSLLRSARSNTHSLVGYRAQQRSANE